MSKDLSSPYNTGFLNDKEGALSSASFRLSGEKLESFLANLEAAIADKQTDEGLQFTFSLNTKNEGKSYYGGVFIKTYVDNYKGKSGGWTAKSAASKETSRIKEHSINGSQHASKEMEARTGSGRSSRFGRG